MKFHCPHCDQKIDAGEELSGTGHQCPSCVDLILIPGHIAPPPLPPRGLKWQAVGYLIIGILGIWWSFATYTPRFWVTPQPHLYIGGLYLVCAFLLWTGANAGYYFTLTTNGINAALCVLSGISIAALIYFGLSIALLGSVTKYRERLR